MTPRSGEKNKLENKKPVGLGEHDSPKKKKIISDAIGHISGPKFAPNEPNIFRPRMHQKVFGSIWPKFYL